MRPAVVLSLALLAGCYTPQQAAQIEAEHAQWAADRAKADSLVALPPDSLTSTDVQWLATYAATRSPENRATADRAAWRAVLTWAGIGALIGVVVLWASSIGGEP